MPSRKYEELRKKRLKEREERLKAQRSGPKKYEELRKRRILEREERLKRERERISESRKKIKPTTEAQLLPERLEEKKREKARDAIESVKTAVREAEEKTKASVHAPEMTKKIDEMLADADESFRSAEYAKAIELSYEIKELVEKASSEASRKAEEKKKRRKEEGKYLYCVIQYSKRKSFGNKGMNSDEVYTFPYRGIAAVVSDSPMKDYELTEDHVRKHEEVIRRVMEEHAVLPAEFGTTIKNGKILRRILKKAYGTTKEWFKRVDNKVELGVKAVLNKDITPVDKRKRKECASDILESLNNKASQSVKNSLFSDRLILNTSFLVDKDGIEEFSNEVARLKEKYSTLNLLYTGPWAPYNFVRIRIGAEAMKIVQPEMAGVQKVK